MMRYNLYLTEEEHKKLKEIAKKNKTSMNSLIKQKVLLNYWDNPKSIAQIIINELRKKKK